MVDNQFGTRPFSGDKAEEVKMQLEEVSFRGYKAFAGGGVEGGPFQTLRVAPLTVVFGKNNSGKSAVTRLPLLLLGGLACEDERLIPLEVRGLRFGARFIDLVHGNDYITQPTFGLKATLDNEKLDVAARFFVTATAPDEPPKVWSYHMRSPEEVNLEIRGLSDRWLLPKGERYQKWRSAAAQYLNNSIHLGPLRARITPTFVVESPTWTGTDGKDAPQWLRLNAPLAEAAEQWFAQNMDGWRLVVDRTLETFSLRVVRSPRMTSNLAYAGEGLQQVLPVVTHQLWRQQLGTGKFLDIVEQPELHLHDAAHAALADLFIDTAEVCRGQTLVETHSKSFLLRIQRRVAEQKISPEKIAIYFVDAKEGGSELRFISLNQDGDLDEWPDGVFEEDFREVAAIRRAQRSRPELGPKV